MALMSSFLQGGEVMAHGSNELLLAALMTSFLWGGLHGSNELLLAGCGGLHGPNELLLEWWVGLHGYNELLLAWLSSFLQVGRSSWL